MSRPDPIQRLDAYDVCWDTPSENASGSMPLGNGDFAANAWVEANGDLLLLLAKSDAWDENSINLKLGRLRLRLDPPLPTASAGQFSQRLQLATGSIEVRAVTVHIRLWIDANRPLLHVDIVSEQPHTASLSVEIWRDQPRQIKTQTSDMFKNLAGKNADPHPTIVTPDRLVAMGQPDRIGWCHHNESRTPDPYEANLRLQGLGDAMESMPHPLLGRTFGAVVEAVGASVVGERQLRSPPATQHRFNVHAVSLHPGTVGSWCQLANEIADRRRVADASAKWIDHCRWWTGFWSRSWLFVTAVDDSERDAAFRVTRAYILQRFMNGAAGRSAFPIKHNGSLFSVGNADDPDFRRWGGPGFWFQNQRLIYWPMFASGDFQMLRAWLRFYAAMLPLQKLRTATYFKHGGAHYPETVTFWGAEVSSHYGWTPFEQRDHPEAESPYLKYYWSGGIELVLMMCEYVGYTSDLAFAKEALLPTADAVLAFYANHYARDADGKIRFAPAQSLETWHEATNPTPDIAGLTHTIRKLLSLREDLIPPVSRAQWQRLLTQLPGIPIGENDGARTILPAETYERKRNVENPELYCVFPYRLFGVQKPDLQLARETFAKRLHRVSACWSQDEIHAALLGLTADAKRGLVERSGPPAHSDSRFPAFWNAFHDWVPDVDHGGVIQMALQLMVLQADGSDHVLLGAWPREWDADFKLHVPGNAVVEGTIRGGELVWHQVSGDRE